MNGRSCQTRFPAGFTWAGEPVKDIIRRHLRSRRYTGRDQRAGSALLPSVEDKIVKFPTHTATRCFSSRRARHHELYVNGLSTSLPGRRPAGSSAWSQGWSGRE